MRRLRSGPLLGSLLAAAAALAASSCTLALGYPGSADELCDNHVDDDLDGLLDCEDECLGRCPEDEAARCGNHHDDDGDGLADYADPSCWPLADVTTSSCASVPGAHAAFDFDGDDEAWAAPSGTLTSDPTGQAPGLSLVVAAPLAMADASEIHTLPGATAGTSAHVRALLDPEVDRVTVSLDVTDAIEDVARLRVVFGHGMLLVEAETVDETFFSGLPAGWYDVSVHVDSLTAVRVAASRDGMDVASVAVTLPDRAWREAHGFRTRLEVERSGPSPVVVASVEVTRDALSRCDDDQVVPRPDLLVTGLLPRGLVTLDDGDFCVLGMNTFDHAGNVAIPLPPTVARSRDRGHAWTFDVHDELVVPGLVVVTRVFRGGSVVDGRLHTLLWDATNVSRLASCTDCAAITDDGPVPTGSDVGVQGYAFDGAVHDIYALDGARLLDRRFPTGARAFDTTTVVTVTDPDSLDHVTRIGDDLIVTRASHPPRLEVVATGLRTPTVGDTLRSFATITGSGDVGACDEYDARSPILAMDAEPRVAGAAATGIVIVRCTGRETYAPSIEGIVPHEIVIRAR